jgi:PAS domain S-box-containing protein
MTDLATDTVQFERLISDVSARLVAAPPDQAHIDAVLDLVRAAFHADHCSFLQIDDETHAHIAYGSYGTGDVDVAESFPWSRARLLAGVPVVVHRMADLPPEAAIDCASWERDVPVRSALMVPIGQGALVRHAAVVHWARKECRIPDSYVRWLRVLGEIVLGAHQHRQACAERAASERRVREHETRVLAAAAAAGLGFSEWTTTARPYVDDRACDLIGITPAQASTARTLWLSRIHPEDRPAVERASQRLIAGEINQVTMEYRYDHPQHGQTWLRHSSCRVAPERGGAVRLIGALEDITLRKRHEEDLQRRGDVLAQENRYLRDAAKRSLGAEQIVGRSPAIRQTLALAEQVARTDSSVLLLGETGSGKERFASYIHDCSGRRDRPMIVVNCSAIPTSLLESELFGREKGAYTGALSKQVGRFELAHGSTLFLDEIGELPTEVQVKLLRVLESRTIERLGNPRPIPIDVRIIAATHRDLAGAIREGRFREDLYYRLNVFPICVPPLRERREDIPLLVHALIEELARTMGKRVEDVDASSLDALVGYAWPGNVRELRNVIERALIMASGPTLHVDLPQAVTRDAVPRTALDRTQILQVLQETAWRIRGPHGAAARLGVKPTTLESRIRKLGLARPGTEA